MPTPSLLAPLIGVDLDVDEIVSGYQRLRALENEFTEREVTSMLAVRLLAGCVRQAPTW